MDFDISETDMTRPYALIGMCTTGFSALEFHTQFLLGFLHNQKTLSIETIVFTRSCAFAEKLRLCEDFIKLRSDIFGDLTVVGLTLVKDIDLIREERNKFIHGYWLISPFHVAAGHVNVSDPKWKYDKSSNSYKAMDSLSIQLSELEALSQRIGALVGRLHKYIKQLDHLARTGNAAAKP
jgi:hypothetical protein